MVEPSVGLATQSRRVVQFPIYQRESALGLLGSACEPFVPSCVKGCNCSLTHCLFFAGHRRTLLFPFAFDASPFVRLVSAIFVGSWGTPMHFHRRITSVALCLFATMAGCSGGHTMQRVVQQLTEGDRGPLPCDRPASAVQSCSDQESIGARRERSFA